MVVVFIRYIVDRVSTFLFPPFLYLVPYQVLEARHIFEVLHHQEDAHINNLDRFVQESTSLTKIKGPGLGTNLV